MPIADFTPAADFAALAPQAGFGQAVFFSLVMDYLDNEIVSTFNAVLSRALQWVSATALVLVTLWIWWQGFRIVTGRSREAMLEFFAESAKRVFVLSVAFGMAVGGTSLFDWLANDLPREVNWIVTGEREPPSTAIDRNLAYMQLAMSSIDVLQTGGDAAVQDAKTRSMWFAAVGTAGPAMVGGAMLLLNKIAMGLFIGFGPLFVLALLFDATKPLFQKWLYYGIGTIFALVLLNLMVEIATEMVTRVAAALWLGNFVSSLMGGAGVEGITSRALQQGGLGMLLSVMIVSTPPMAAAFFNGVMGSFTGYNAFAGQGGVMANGQPYNAAPATLAGGAGSVGSRGEAPVALRPELLIGPRAGGGDAVPAPLGEGARGNALGIASAGPARHGGGA